MGVLEALAEGSTDAKMKADLNALAAETRQGREDMKGLGLEICKASCSSPAYLFSSKATAGDCGCCLWMPALLLAFITFFVGLAVIKTHTVVYDGGFGGGFTYNHGFYLPTSAFREKGLDGTLTVAVDGFTPGASAEDRIGLYHTMVEPTWLATSDRQFDVTPGSTTASNGDSWKALLPYNGDSDSRSDYEFYINSASVSGTSCSADKVIVLIDGTVIGTAMVDTGAAEYISECTKPNGCELEITYESTAGCRRGLTIWMEVPAFSLAGNSVSVYDKDYEYPDGGYIYVYPEALDASSFEPSSEIVLTMLMNRAIPGVAIFFLSLLLWTILAFVGVGLWAIYMKSKKTDIESVGEEAEVPGRRKIEGAARRKRERRQQKIKEERARREQGGKKKDNFYFKPWFTDPRELLSKQDPEDVFRCIHLTACILFVAMFGLLHLLTRPSPVQYPGYIPGTQTIVETSMLGDKKEGQLRVYASDYPAGTVTVKQTNAMPRALDSEDDTDVRFQWGLDGDLLASGATHTSKVSMVVDEPSKMEPTCYLYSDSCSGSRVLATLDGTTLYDGSVASFNGAYDLPCSSATGCEVRLEYTDTASCMARCVIEHTGGETYATAYGAYSSAVTVDQTNTKTEIWGSHLWIEADDEYAGSTFWSQDNSIVVEYTPKTMGLVGELLVSLLVIGGLCLVGCAVWYFVLEAREKAKEQPEPEP
ncbi:hypothetical protein KIPB_003689 [Kipferlia bialata]|uniref:Uncharacterized protein n=1 Tax=Kipferlia bialata TaxID=797122 RepID=A0A9K3CSS5_9EUKA|nr:hypothetical protein KIPB_003689 [Kipferlia bialata]|eukprot:g3689.t1